jgi:hypothetical protein
MPRTAAPGLRLQQWRPGQRCSAVAAWSGLLVYGLVWFFVLARGVPAEGLLLPLLVSLAYVTGRAYVLAREHHGAAAEKAAMVLTVFAMLLWLGSAAAGGAGLEELAGIGFRLAVAVIAGHVAVIVWTLLVGGAGQQLRALRRRWR